MTPIDRDPNLDLDIVVFHHEATHWVATSSEAYARWFESPTKDRPQFLTGSFRSATTVSSPSGRHDVLGEKIIRTRFMKEILDGLQKILRHANTPLAALHAGKILHAIKSYWEAAPDDMMVRLVQRLYDAMAYQDRWQTYSAQQYEIVRKELEKQTERNNVTRESLRAFLEIMREAGMDPLPYAAAIPVDAAGSV